MDEGSYRSARRDRGWLAAVGVAFLFAVAACSSNDFTLGGPLDLTISSSSPVAVTDSLQLDYDVVGRVLIGLAVDWGDGSVPDSLGLSGAQTAGGRLFHQYPDTGTYTIDATVVDQVDGSASEQLVITIIP